MDRVTIHLGYPKAASTSLQVNFFSQHPDIEYLGIFPVGNKGLTDTLPIAGKATEVRELLAEEIHNAVVHPQDLASLDRIISARESGGLWPRLPQHLASISGHCVYSDEAALSMFGPSLDSRLSCLRRVFGESQPVVVLRNQWSLLASKYRDRPGNPDNWGRGPALPPDRWVERLLADPNRRRLLFYDQVLDLVESALGQKPIVVLFEELTTQWWETLAQLCEAMEIRWSPEIASELGSTGQNRGVTRRYQAVRSLAYRAGLGRLARYARNTSLGTWAAKSLLNGPTQRVQLSPDTIGELVAVLGESNRSLEVKLGRPLQHLGYRTN